MLEIFVFDKPRLYKQSAFYTAGDTIHSDTSKRDFPFMRDIHTETQREKIQTKQQQRYAFDL